MKRSAYLNQEDSINQERRNSSNGRNVFRFNARRNVYANVTNRRINFFR
jgi:hypothetical protein